MDDKSDCLSPNSDFDDVVYMKEKVKEKVQTPLSKVLFENDENQGGSENPASSSKSNLSPDSDLKKNKKFSFGPVKDDLFALPHTTSLIYCTDPRYIEIILRKLDEQGVADVNSREHIYHPIFDPRNGTLGPKVQDGKMIETYKGVSTTLLLVRYRFEYIRTISSIGGSACDSNIQFLLHIGGIISDLSTNNALYLCNEYASDEHPEASGNPDWYATWLCEQVVKYCIIPSYKAAAQSLKSNLTDLSEDQRTKLVYHLPLHIQCDPNVVYQKGPISIKQLIGSIARMMEVTQQRS